ncbi:MAG: N-acetylmannosamine-6-phosphate 2-epimerase [Treponema sp.]|nr:N-acetylmannosamine-6-phosphate 2-epimerase [Treponema sp.]MCL2271846.1 N-acetylmannosamine-6-phosphate 2-epimerase [Treponema sp.]
MSVLDDIKGGLIVSCQALEDEPLHSSFIMARMAEAAILGGAVGIRANSTQDICEIKKTVNLPVIGIIKTEYPDSHVYITPSMTEVDALVKCGCEIIAMDAANRKRPSGEPLAEFFARVREKYPDKLFMGDCSTVQEGMDAAAMGFDLIATTLCGYTDDSRNDITPNYEMMYALARNSGKPVIAEGNIWTPEQLRQVMRCGVHAAVVGSAITRPMLITKRFVSAIKGE